MTCSLHPEELKYLPDEIDTEKDHLLTERKGLGDFFWSNQIHLQMSKPGGQARERRLGHEGQAPRCAGLATALRARPPPPSQGPTSVSQVSQSWQDGPTGQTHAA